MNRARPRPLDPKHETFAVYLGAALDRVPEGTLPDWLKEMRDDGFFERLVEEFGLPPQARDELMAIVLATDQCLSVPAGALAPITKKEARTVEAQVARLRASVSKLEPRAPPSLSVELHDERLMPDGTITFVPTPGIIPRAVQLLDELEREFPNICARSGRPTSPLRWANVALTATIDRLTPSMSSGKRAALADALFADVRRRHGHESRAHFRDDDEVPRSRDMVRRVAPRSRPAVRKTLPNND